MDVMEKIEDDGECFLKWMREMLVEKIRKMTIDVGNKNRSKNKVMFTI